MKQFLSLKLIYTYITLKFKNLNKKNNSDILFSHNKFDFV